MLLFLPIYQTITIMASRAIATALRTAARTTFARSSVAIRPMSALALRRTAVKSTVSYIRNAKKKKQTN